MDHRFVASVLSIRVRRLELLQAFAADFRDVQVSGFIKRQHVRQVELSQRLAFAADAQVDFAARIQTQNLIRPAVGHEDTVLRIDRHSVRRETVPDTESFSIQVKYLDSIILPVSDQHAVVFVDDDAVRQIEFSRLITGCAP